MIVPAPRLLLWFGGVFVPAAFLAGPAPELLPLVAAAATAFLAVALLDALLGVRRLYGFALELPAITRLAKGREGKLEVTVLDERRRGLTLKVGLGFPAAIAVESPDLPVRLAPEMARGRVQWTCVPAERGRFELDRGYVGLGSPLGLWLARAAVPVRGEVRVYPDLFPERKRLAAMFLNRGPWGVHARRQLGQGREFESLREYIPGDGYDTIQWKATAKRDRPVTKVYQIERTQEVYVIIDASRLTGRTVGALGGGTDPERRADDTILERFLAAGLILCQAAQRQGDLFGVMGFADRVQTFLPARNGAAHYRACRDAIYLLTPRGVNPDFDEVFTFIRNRLRRRALLLFLTCLDDRYLGETFTRNVALLERQHLVLTGVLRPAAVRPLFTGPEPNRVADLYSRLGGHLLWSGLRELERELRRRGVTLALLDDERLCPQLVAQYLKIKQRQLL